MKPNNNTKGKLMKIPTNPMYDIDENAVVRLISTGEIIPEYRNRFKRRAVKIRGKSHKASSHPLDRLMLLTYKPLPENKDPEWLSIRFEDNDKDNIRIDNLMWDDTYWIPSDLLGIEFGTTVWVSVYGHPNLEIRLCNHEPIFRCSSSHREIGFKNNHDGYRIISEPNGSKDLRLHRLVALTFLPHPLDTDHLTVNHKDSDKSNNRVSNLEWATFTQNNFHAYSEGPRRETVKKIRILNIEDKTEKVFSGFQDLARYLNVLPGNVHSVLDRRDYEGRPYKGYIFKYDNDPRSWVELAESGPRGKRTYKGSIACFDIASKTTTVYQSFKKLEKETSINIHTVYKLLSQKNITPYKGKYIQKYNDGVPLEWPDYPEEVIRVFSNINVSDRPIEVTDDIGITKYYSSVTEWCKEDRENRCDPAVMCRYLKQNNGKCRWRQWALEIIDLGKYSHQYIKTQ